MDLGGYTATGPRDANEDNYFTLDFSDVDSFSNGVISYVMVSDGMGGYQGGDVASGLAVSSAESYVSQLLEMAAGNQIDFDAQSALGEVIQNAHEAILAETRARGGKSMGATFVGAFLSPTHAWIAHVGDSRAYLVRDGEITQITEDHSQVGRMLSRGLITEEEAQTHPARNRIERALGFSEAEPDFNEVDLQPDDALMLCSDGVYTVLDREAICGCIQGARDAEGAAKRIVKSALNQGTDDNSTAVVAVNGEGVAGKAPRRRSQPTIRTSAVPGMRYGSVNPVRTGSSQGRRSAPGGRSQRSGRSMRSMLIPLAVAVVAVVAIVAVVVMSNPVAGGGSVEPGGTPQASEPSSSTAQDSTVGQPGATVPPAPSSSAASDSASVSDSASASAGTFSSEQIVQSGLLKYADADGEAYRFSDTWPQVVAGANVGTTSAYVETGAQSYQINGSPGEYREYRTLRDSYRTDLLNDYAAYFNGGGQAATQSALAQLVDAYSMGSYEAFLGELMSNGVTREALDAEVSKLILDTSCFAASSAEGSGM